MRERGEGAQGIVEERDRTVEDHAIIDDSHIQARISSHRLQQDIISRSQTGHFGFVRVRICRLIMAEGFATPTYPTIIHTITVQCFI